MRPPWQRILLAASPVALIVFSLLHGGDFILEHGLAVPDEEQVVHYLADIPQRWQALHLFGLILFPLLGVTVWLMLPRERYASGVSRVALAAFVVLYVAFDSAAGIGTSVMLTQREELAAPGQAVVDSLVSYFLFDRSSVVFQIGRAASVAWAIGAIAGAVALWREWGWQPGLPLALAGVAFGMDHSPPFGTVAGIALGITVWRLLACERTRQAVA